MYSANMSAARPLPVFDDQFIEAFGAGMTEDQFGALWASTCADLTEVNQPTTENLLQDNDYLPLTMNNEQFVETMTSFNPATGLMFKTDSALDYEASLETSGILLPTEVVVANAPIDFEANDVSMIDAPSDLMDDELMSPETIRALMEFDPRAVQLNQNQGAQVYPDPETPKRNDTQIVYGLPTPGSNSELEEAQAPATASTTTPPTPPEAETTTVNLTERSIESLPGHQTQFSSLAAIRESMRQVDLSHRPETDKSIPTTAEEKQVLVGKLIVVLKNMEGIRDSEASIRTFNNRKFTDTEFELTAWEILEAMITRHQFGASLTPAHAKRKTGLFKDRFLSACNALNCSKSVAKHCLDSEFVKTFVDHPQGALGRVVGNQKVNGRKGVLLKAGKEALSK